MFRQKSRLVFFAFEKDIRQVVLWLIENIETRFAKDFSVHIDDHYSFNFITTDIRNYLSVTKCVCGVDITWIINLHNTFALNWCSLVCMFASLYVRIQYGPHHGKMGIMPYAASVCFWDHGTLHLCV